jgi:hypothetical protein
MAATHLTLEEAAEQLGISPEEFKKRLKTETAFKGLVPIRDGSNLRFKAGAIEELGRQLGAASNPELPLAPLESVTPDSDDFKLPSKGAKEAKKEEKPNASEPLNLTSSDDDIFSLAPDSAKAEGKKPSKPGSDSDVRLESGKSKKAKSEKDDSSDESVVPTEELSIDFNGPGSAVIKGGSSAKLSAPKSSGKIPKSDSGKGLANPGASDSSEFELSLDADSDDFELKLNTDASDEVDLGGMPKDIAGSSRRGGESGINLRDPADSGISLEKGKGKSEDKAKAPAADGEASDPEVDFELTLDSSAGSALKLGGLKPGSGKPITDQDSDSEFELTLDDSSDSGLEAAANESADAEKRDIFETDFEIPPMDESGSEAVALEPDTDLEKSDSDVEEVSDSDVVAEDTSSSEAVVLEDEDELKPKARKRKAKGASDEDDVDLADVDLADEEDASASKALKGLKSPRTDEDEEEEEVVPAAAGAYRPVPWGPIPALFLFPALAISLIGGLMAFELLQTMWGYQQPRKPAAPLVRALATNLDMELKDQ